MNRQQLRRQFFLVALITIVALGFFILKPFVGVIALAATLAIIFQPVNHYVQKVITNDSIAALITTCISIIAIFTPFVLIGIQVTQEAQVLYAELSTENTQISSGVHSVNSIIQSISPVVSIDVQQASQQLIRWALQRSGLIFSSAAQVVAGFLLSLLGLFYLLRDGRKLRRWLINTSPLKNTHDELIYARLQRAIGSVVKGSLGIAILQGISTGAGLAIFGVPHAVLWGSVAVLSALIPNIGTALVITPAIGYLLWISEYMLAVGLLAWGIVAVGLIDNLLGPKLIQRGLHVHPFLILLSVLGGIATFGPIGFLIGPLTLSLLFALLDIHSDVLLEGKVKSQSR